MKTTGNTILITGGTSGIGFAFAKHFHQLGNQVIVCGRRKVRLEKLSNEFPGMVCIPCDVSKVEARENLIQKVVADFPDLNILINNAGIQLAVNLQENPEISRLNQEIDTNLKAPIHLTILITPHLKSKSTSAVINISSGLAFVPIALMPVYCATKAAIHSFSLSLRHQLRDTSIKVFEIAPPSVDTELGSDRRTDPNETHGGITVEEFLHEAMEAIATDKLEAMIGQARNLREKNEILFGMLNH